MVYGTVMGVARERGDYRSHVATAPAMNDLLLQFLKSGSTDQQFVEKVRNVVFSKDALLAAKTLSLYDAKKVINKLDKVRKASPPIQSLLMSVTQALDVATIAQNKNLWKGCLKFLCRICGHHNLLPRSYKLTFALQKGDKPVGSGGFAEIWRGFYNGQRVAVKVLRVYEADNIEEIRKVRRAFVLADQQTPVSLRERLY